MSLADHLGSFWNQSIVSCWCPMAEIGGIPDGKKKGRGREGEGGVGEDQFVGSCVGIMLGSIWSYPRYSGIRLGTCRDHLDLDSFRIFCGTFLDQSGISGIRVGSIWDYSKIRLGLFCNQCGITLEIVWDPCGITLGSF